MQEIRFFRNPAVIILLFGIIGFILYAPVLQNGFLSDDYDSLYRIYIQKRILYKEFLRPMIDLSFYFNYLISGLSPWSYYVFNVLVHITNALLLYRFAYRYPVMSGENQGLFALLSSFLFLIYPFHNESIVWLSGRLSSLATLFALLSLIVAQERQGRSALLLSALYYLLGLLCYESIIFLPLIHLLLSWQKNGDWKKTIRNGMFWAGTAFIYLLLRFAVSGEIAGQYGDRLADHHIGQKIGNAGKIFGRLFLPGSEHQHLLIFLTMILFGISCFLLFIILRKPAHRGHEKIKIISLLLMLGISLFLPVAFGVSTRTSEGERLLYFPSCFLCMILTLVILRIFPNKIFRISCFGLIALYFIWFLEKNNQQWVKASEAASAILSRIEQKGRATIILINVPDELEGAYVFRNGLNRACLVNHIDTAEVRIMNYLKRTEYLKTGKIITVEKTDSSMRIYPDLQVTTLSNGRVEWKNISTNTRFTPTNDRNLIYYWNKEQLIPLF